MSSPTSPKPAPTPAAAPQQGAHDVPPAPLVFGPFMLDRADARLLRDGRAVPLTPKAFDVLHVLASRSDRLVTKQELLDAVWPDVLVCDASVKVCVREIRKALEDDAAAPRYIQTVHRRGYRFVGQTRTALPTSPQAEAPRRPPAAVPPPGTLAAAAALETSLVGRERELAMLEAWFDRASAGERQCVLVTGGPGTGKTAVVEFFLRWTGHAVRPDAAAAPLVLTGHCFQQFGMAEPYMPVWEALGRGARDPSAGDAVPQLAAMLARHAAAAYDAPPAAGAAPVPPAAATAAAPALATAGGEPRGMSDRLLREIADGIDALAGDARPVILLLEDVHWADYSTLDLISALARRRGSPARLMLIATYRPDELSAPTGRAGAEHPLRDVTQGLLAGGLCQELSMRFLDEARCAEYLVARFPGADLPPALAGRLHQRTDGHPLFLVQLVNDLVDQGRLVRRGGRWQLARTGARPGAAEPDADWWAALDTGVPHTVRAMIVMQLERLGDGERTVLEAAAVAGVEFSAAAVAAALGCSGDGAEDVASTERACDVLARRHHLLEPRGLAEWPDGTAAARYHFTHELYHSVVYEQVSPARAARLHAAIAARLEAAWGDRASEAAAELAMHCEAGRDWPRAVRHLRQAAAAAARQYAHREAVQYLRRALALLDRLAPTARAEHELPLLMALGVNLQVTQGFAAPEVQAVHARAHALCQSRTSPAGTRTAFPVVWGIWLFHKVRSDLRRADEMSRQLLALARVSGDDGLLLQAHQAMCVTNLCLGNPDVTRDHMEQAAAVYDPARHAGATETYGQDPGVATLAFGSVALWLMNRPDEAARAGRRSMDLARRLAQPSSLALATHFHAMLHQLRGDAPAARELAGATIELAAREGFSFWHAGGTILRGWADATAGNGSTTGDDAIAAIRGGLAAWLATGSRTYNTYFLGLLADALLRHGRADEALAALDEALAAAQDLPEGLYEAELHRLKGRALVETCDADVAAARASFSRAVAVARAQGAHWLIARAAAELNGTEPVGTTASRGVN